eukprot:m.65541 g.65541  ORF g.65541 m.65541 type:complete len:1289 (+) comp8301_c0_seq1:154-4020(+)
MFAKLKAQKEAEQRRAAEDDSTSAGQLVPPSAKATSGSRPHSVDAPPLPRPSTGSSTDVPAQRPASVTPAASPSSQAVSRPASTASSSTLQEAHKNVEVINTRLVSASDGPSTAAEASDDTADSATGTGDSTARPPSTAAAPPSPHESAEASEAHIANDNDLERTDHHVPRGDDGGGVAVTTDPSEPRVDRSNSDEAALDAVEAHAAVTGGDAVDAMDETSGCATGEEGASAELPGALNATPHPSDGQGEPPLPHAAPAAPALEATPPAVVTTATTDDLTHSNETEVEVLPNTAEPKSESAPPPPPPKVSVEAAPSVDGKSTSTTTATTTRVGEDDDDDLMAELEAELNIEHKQLAPSPAAKPRVSHDSPSTQRKNPFADPQQLVAPHYEPEVETGPLPAGSVSVDEHDRVQADLDAVRQQRDELQLKNAALEKQIETMQQQKSGARSLLGRFRKDKGAVGGATTPASSVTGDSAARGSMDKGSAVTAQSLAAAEAEIAVLKKKVSELKSEIVLHKETKDQLATDLRSAMSDFDDQRATIGSTIATLSAENATLKARLDARAARAEAGGGDGEDPDESERISVDAAEASLRVELHRQVQYLETKCSRAEAEARDQAHKHELLKADLAKAEAAIASLTAERTTLKADNVRLNDELSGLISEGHTASTRLRLAEDETANLRVRIAEFEATLEAEAEKTSNEHDRALDAEGTLKLVRSELERTKQALAKAEADRERAVADKATSLDGLTSTNAALTTKLSEHEAAMSAKEERLAELAARLAEGAAWETLAAGGGSLSDDGGASTSSTSPPPASASPQHGDDDDSFHLPVRHVTLKRTLSGQLGQVEAQILEALREREKMKAQMAQHLDERRHFEDRLADVKQQMEDVCAARDALMQENKLVVDGNTKMSGALAATESALERERARAAAAETEQGVLATRASTSERLAEDATRKVAELEEALAQLTATKESLESAVATAADNLRDAKESGGTRAKELEDKIAVLDAEAVKAREKIQRLEKALSDSEAQRTLDQKVSTKMIKDLSKQLQKQKPPKGNGTNGSPATTHRRAGAAGAAGAGHRRSASATIELTTDGGPTATNGTHAEPVTPRRDRTASTQSTSQEESPQASKLQTKQHSSPLPRRAGPNGARAENHVSSRHAVVAASGSGASGGGASALAGCTSCRKLTRKIEFYESHVKDLTDDVKNKTKLIQSFLLREKKGQLLPSVPQSQPAPSKTLLSFATRNPSSELTAEANRKLQQVTEDTLLQNIHLRESLDVMSAQIAELQQQKRPT